MSTKDLLLTEKEKVRAKLGKKVSEVNENVSILKEWLKTQNHLPEIPDDNMIEFILTNCKYSIEKTKQNLDIYYTIRSLVPEVFENSHPTKSDNQKLVAKMGQFVVLPKLTDTLCRVTFIKYSEGGADVFDPYAITAHMANMYEVRVHEDLVISDVYLIDFKYLSMSHVLKLNPALFKRFTLILEKVWSNRLAGLHFFNHPPYIDKLLAVAKLFFKPKLYERIHLHADLDSLYKHIPQDMLPSEYGGKEKSVQELCDLWQIKFKENESRFDELQNMKVDESLRPEPLKNSDVLGYYGNFKKVDID